MGTSKVPRSGWVTGANAPRSRSCGRRSRSAIVGTGANGILTACPRSSHSSALRSSSRGPEARFERISREDPLDRRRVLLAVELGQIDQCAEGLPLRRCERGNSDPAVLARIDAARERGREAVDPHPPRSHPSVLCSNPAHLGEAQGGLEDALVDVSSAQSGEASVKGAHAADERRRACHELVLVAAREKRRALRSAHPLHDARQCVDDAVVRGEVAIRAGLTEPRERRQHELRLERPELRVADAELVEKARCEALDQNVRSRDQPAQQPSRRWTLEVQRGAPLVRVEVGKDAAGLTLRRPLLERSQASRPIAGGGLQLDHRRAEVREQLRAVRAGHVLGQVEDDEVGQCFRAQRPLKTGDRFSWKDAKPSRASSVSRLRAPASSSWASESRRP